MGRSTSSTSPYTKNGRATFPMAALGIWRDPRQVGPVNELLILNRNDNLIPGVARLSREQAAAFFMLGETQGTSAGGAAEEGKALRVPGTNPFYPHRDEEQANRFWELMGTHPFDVYLVNTGRVGGPDGDPNSKKLQIEHSGAIVKAIAEETITWDRGPRLRVRRRQRGARESMTWSCSSRDCCTSAPGGPTSTLESWSA